MKIDLAVDLLAALAHSHRLSAFKKLVEAGEAGLPAGVLAQQLGVAAGTLSFHLKELSHVGLITARADRQFIYYRANFDVMGQLVDHLTQNCCGGRDCLAPRRSAKPQAEKGAKRAA